MSWVYVRSKTEQLYTVGFFDPDGGWHTDSDHDTRDAAADRCAYLNGRASLNEIEEVLRRAVDDVLAKARAPRRLGPNPYDLND
jgi:hypothetical protein